MKINRIIFFKFIRRQLYQKKQCSNRFATEHIFTLQFRMKVFTQRFRVVNLLDTSRKSLEFERFDDHSTSRIKFHRQKFSREYEMSLSFKLLGIDNFSKIRLKFASNAFPFLHPSVSPFLLFRSRRYGQSLENVSRPKTICTRQQKMTLDVIYPRRKFVSPPIRHPPPLPPRFPSF